MNKLADLEDWILHENVSDDTRLVNATIYLNYPDPQQFIDFEPKERTKKIDRYYKDGLARLTALKLFENPELTGSMKRPIGIKAIISFNSLPVFSEFDFIKTIAIHSITDANKVETAVKPEPKFFCVKMTVVIDIEGLDTKMESIEERYVMVQAESFDDAYDKLEKQKDKYAEPYLNPDGRFVRWRIDSFDDCFKMDSFLMEDLNGEGVEVFSKLRSRKRRSSDIWDGRS